MIVRPAYIAALGIAVMTWGGGWMLFGLAVLMLAIWID